MLGWFSDIFESLIACEARVRRLLGFEREQCEKCRALFDAHENNKKLADLLEENYPECGCERHSVGTGSPGRVRNSENLLRIIISPRDYDPASDYIAHAPFEKAFANGVSVCRERASDRDLKELALEGLVPGKNGEPRKVWKICIASTEKIRSICGAGDARAFCVYDQTVSRIVEGQPPISSHVGIFLRLPPPGTPDRKKAQKDFAGLLREAFLADARPPGKYRNGLLNELKRGA